MRRGFLTHFSTNIEKLENVTEMLDFSLWSVKNLCQKSPHTFLLIQILMESDGRFATDTLRSTNGDLADFLTRISVHPCCEIRTFYIIFLPVDLRALARILNKLF